MTAPPRPVNRHRFGYTAREMPEQHASPYVVARGDLRRMRELAGRFAEVGIASELVRPDPRERHG